MTDTKLITLLKRLSPDEFKELERFVASPYFSRERNFTPLFSALKSFYPGFEDKTFTKENLFKKLYTKEIYAPENSDHKLKILFSGLYKLGLDFLRQIEFNNDKERREYYLLNQLRMKKFNKEFEKMFAETTGENPVRKGSIFDFINKVYLFDLKKSYCMGIHDYPGTFESSLSMREYSVIASLINCFRFESEKKIMYGYNIEVRNTLMSNLMENLNLQELLEKMKDTNDRFYPYVLVYYAAYKMEKDSDNTDYFFELKNLLKKYHNIFGRIEKFGFYIIMETYCTFRKKTPGGSIFELETFQIYNEMLESKNYKVNDNEKFNIVLFRNMILTACHLHKYEWIERFINDYSYDLHPSHKDDMIYYSLTHLFFGRKDFEKALESVMKIKFDLFIYKIDVKIFLLKIYYELGYYEQAYSTLDTTIHYLKNTSDLSDSHRNSVRMFLKFLKDLLRYRSDPKAMGSQEIDFQRKKITEEKFFNSREWILQKHKEL